MSVKNLFAICMFAAIFCSSNVSAQIVPGHMAHGRNNSSFDSSHNYYLSLGVRKYINSYTSYEFLDPDFKFVDPLSKLEWPWEQTYGVVKTGLILKGLQVNFEGASTLLTYSGLKAQDSDWTDETLPDQKTIFSDAEARPRGWTFDASFGFDLPFSDRIRWIVGYRAQQFRFTYTDMHQNELYRPDRNGFDPGEAIQFTQDYRHYYGGAVTGAQFDMGSVSSYMSGTILAIRLLGDVGYVTANNVDYHVLRLPAPRHTYEVTSGISWRLNLATDFRINDRFTVGLAGEFMRIRTQGSHRMTNPEGLDEQGRYVRRIDESWDGARVWSDQKFVELNGAMSF